MASQWDSRGEAHDTTPTIFLLHTYRYRTADRDSTLHIRGGITRMAEEKKTIFSGI
jgi:hypothetical protein